MHRPSSLLLFTELCAIFYTIASSSVCKGITSCVLVTRTSLTVKPLLEIHPWLAAPLVGKGKYAGPFWPAIQGLQSLQGLPCGVNTNPFYRTGKF